MFENWVAEQYCVPESTRNFSCEIRATYVQHAQTGRPEMRYAAAERRRIRSDQAWLKDRRDARCTRFCNTIFSLTQFSKKV